MITYLIGDATHPQGDGRKVIAHICNDFGGWGRGFVLALSYRWKEPETAYREWYRNGQEVIYIPFMFKGTMIKHTRPFQKGWNQYVKVEKDIVVVNMLAQKGNKVDYSALRKCLARIGNRYIGKDVTIHMPRIGCGLGGGTWEEVEPIISTTLRGFHVFVYDLPKSGI